MLNVTYQKPFNYGANHTLKGLIVWYVNCITTKLFYKRIIANKIFSEKQKPTNLLDINSKECTFRRKKVVKYVSKPNKGYM